MFFPKGCICANLGITCHKINRAVVAMDWYVFPTPPHIGHTHSRRFSVRTFEESIWTCQPWHSTNFEILPCLPIQSQGPWGHCAVCEEFTEVKSAGPGDTLTREWVLVGPVETSELVVILVCLWDALAHFTVFCHWLTRYVRSDILSHIFPFVIALSFTRLAERQNFATAAVYTFSPTVNVFFTKSFARLITAAPIFIPCKVKTNFVCKELLLTHQTIQSRSHQPVFFSLLFFRCVAVCNFRAVAKRSS